MSRFIEGEARTQSLLFPERLDDWIEEDNPVRVIDAFVDELDMKELGFDGAVPADTGRPGYHPRPKGACPPGDTATVCSASIYPTPWTLLASEIHLHLRGLVFNGLTSNVHERLLNCAGKCER